MNVHFEWSIRQINKIGEELCGDSFIIAKHPEHITIALSDGLGSGVKASILATLTTRIAINLLENDLSLDEVVQTLTATLPVCKVRNLAYSTFVIARFYSDGKARIVEFDTPNTIFIRNKKKVALDYSNQIIDGKTIRETELDLQKGDWVFFVSDGVLNAGIGGLYPLGWGWDKTADYLEKHIHKSLSADDIVNKSIDTIRELYADNTGDDVSIIAIKVRRKLFATILTGPPSNKSLDEGIINNFINSSGKHIICGGTTAKIVSYHLGKPLDVDLNTMTHDVPPVGHINGIDLVSEGILTLTKVNELLKSDIKKKNIRFKNDGASNLLRILFSVDCIRFIVGQAINPAHQNPELPNQLGIRSAIINDISEKLKKRNKEVFIEYV